MDMDEYESHWRNAIPQESIQSDQIHVWRTSLDLADSHIENLIGILSRSEFDRAKKFHFERDRNQFIAAHGILRQILAFYLGEKPGDLTFENTSLGKPFLVTHNDHHLLSFNLSHSGSLALYAITQNRNVGIDIENVRDHLSIDEIALRFFSQNEIKFLNEVSDKQEKFFQLWTRKEAFMKTNGKGFSLAMNKFDVSSQKGNEWSPIQYHGDAEGRSWYGKDLFPARGYKAAIVVEQSECNLSQWHFSP